jgi:hypothetical protein
MKTKRELEPLVVLPTHPLRQVAVLGQTAANGCSLATFCRSTLTGEGLLNLSGTFGVWWFQPIQQAIGAGFEELGQPGEYGQRNRIAATLNVADGFPMHAHEFTQAFLGYTGFHPCLPDSLAKHSQNLLISHTA